MCLATMVMLYFGFRDNSRAVVKPTTPALQSVSASDERTAKWTELYPRTVTFVSAIAPFVRSSIAIVELIVKRLKLSKGSAP